jgi:hypothetical protein
LKTVVSPPDKGSGGGPKVAVAVGDGDGDGVGVSVEVAVATAVAVEARVVAVGDGVAVAPPFEPHPVASPRVAASASATPVRKRTRALHSTCNGTATARSVRIPLALKGQR